MSDLLDMSNVIDSFKAVSTDAKQMMIPGNNAIFAITTGISNLGTGALSAWSNRTIAGMNLAARGVTAAGSAVGTILNGWHEEKMQKINNKHERKMQKMLYEHEEYMLEEKNRHAEVMLKEQLRHERYIIREQRKVLEKILEVSLATYNKKAELLTAQMNCIESTYQQELRLINENISFLEHERVKIKDNMELYMELTRDIRERYKTKDELIRAYNEAHVNLTTAMKCLELEKPLGYSFQESAAQLKILGDK